MVEGRGHPAAGLVTILAGVVGGKVGGVLAGRLGAIMAAEAGAGNTCVRKPGAGPAVCRFVAILAQVRRRHMAGRLAGCLGAIVTTEAGSGDPRMVKPCACERIGVVAILALIAGLRMVRGFSRSFDPVVAGDAALRGAGMVEPVDRPLPRRVAAVALGLRDNVVCRLAIGPHIIVAARAVSRRSLEDGALVARLAPNGHMRACQWEACREMIERRLASGRCGRASDDRQCEHRSQECCKPSPDHANPDSLIPTRAWTRGFPDRFRDPGGHATTQQASNQPEDCNRLLLGMVNGNIDQRLGQFIVLLNQSTAQ